MNTDVRSGGPVVRTEAQPPQRELEDEVDLDAMDKAQRHVTWLGLYSNVLLAGTKGFIGFSSGSMSLIADAMHSGSDLCGDFVALAAITLSKRPADKLHPYGYGHYESLGTLLVSTLLVGGGAGIGWHSLNQLLVVSATEATMVRHIPAALIVIGASIAVKEWLYRITVKVGQETHSPVLVANAWHHRTDALSSILSLIGVGGAWFGWYMLDPVAGLLVSGMVLKAGVEIGWDACQDLTDRRRESDYDVIGGVYKVVENLALQPTSAVVDAHDVRVRRLGHYLLLDLHLRVEPRLSVSGGYVESNRVKRHIYKAYPRISEVMIHVQAHPRRSAMEQSGDMVDASFVASGSPQTLVQVSPEPAQTQREDQHVQQEKLIMNATNDVEPKKVRRELSLHAESRQPMAPRRSFTPIPNQFAKNVRSHLEIEGDVRAAVMEAAARDPVINALSHCQIYYDVAESRVFVEINLVMEKTVTLLRADEAAQVAREAVLSIPDVYSVDAHVELGDEDTDDAETTEPEKQPARA
ncbi:Metal tolerance protein 2 [Hondaea fermentalgiana]|uniref:Metal tolerance protein 2 n=1 Tax=Hondaea fermentalgiana TaxID=2315210 RepID=A0A2R5GHE2_9STRA|nr:Metal tolerance protein 2 [Hondaea fermentalgiana]|eukprot:GBG27701.1 Metal tolerance protein 2 [Hondaea fermentalgiana]